MVQFNLKKCNINVAMVKSLHLHHANAILYKINFVKMHEAEVANLLQFPTRDGALKL